MARTSILTLLAGGDRRSIGRSDQVAEMVCENPALFRELMAGLWSADPLVRMRAADASEKVARKCPAWLRYKKELLGLMSETKDPEIRWHLAVMIPRLPLTQRERQQVVSALSSYLEDQSSLVKTFALQGLADLACDAPDIRPRVRELLRQATRGGTPAMKARSRKLLLQMEADEGRHEGLAGKGQRSGR
ncbi:MAG: hypothetical protein WA738_04200 [Candidatus Angelobacter sp.]